MSLKYALSSMKLTTPHTLQIRRSAFGSSPRIPFQTLNQASAAYRAFIDKHGIGSSEAGVCVILNHAGAIVGHVSYNGRVWLGEEWKPGDVPVFDPQTEEVCAS